MTRNVDVRIDGRTGKGLDERWVRRVVEAGLASEGVKSGAEVSVLITGDSMVRELNRRYLATDDTTDVLAFPMEEDVEDAPFPSMMDGVRQLGEVIISYPQARRQAKERGHSAKDEVAVLLTHGVLHLLGYDHDTAEADARMKKREAEILARLSGELG